MSILKNVCYRCRKASTESSPLINCNYCTLFWHVECLIQPMTSIPDDWKCPRHQERSHTRKYKKKTLNGNVVKVIQQEDDMTFHEANNIVKYGSVVYSIPVSSIEADFLNYARKCREHAAAKNNKEQYEKTLEHAEQWLNNIASFQLYDGIQMLLDAANYDTNQTSLYDNENTLLELDKEEYDKLEAIEQLIRLKGEDNLLKELSYPYE
ncbi:MAG: hypothetical protein EXX96DRAFT_568470 [Benjaminiella poitrasii]|nr:MAG: hypothetical protein EXX96DRAFT_568470 [Benjaminiella poitrasii]